MEQEEAQPFLGGVGSLSQKGKKGSARDQGESRPNTHRIRERPRGIHGWAHQGCALGVQCTILELPESTYYSKKLLIFPVPDKGWVNVFSESKGKPRQTTPVTGVAPTQITSWPSVCRQVCGILTRGEQSEHSCGRKFNLLMIRQEATHPPTFLLVVKVFLGPSQVIWASLVAQTIKNLPAMQETQV